MDHGVVWLVIMAVLIVIEIATLGLTTIWFAGGALAAFIVSIFAQSWLLEGAIGLIVALFLLFYTRPIVKKYFNKGLVKTNYESLIGRDAKVTERISNIDGTGAVNLSGQIWTARAAEESIILDVDTIVTVARIQGVKLIVEKKVEV